MAEFKLTESVEINRPAADIFQYVNDISRTPEWRPGVVIRDLTGEPLAIGSSWSEVTKFLGREMTVSFEVTAMDQDRQCVMKMDGGTVVGDTTWDFSPGAEGGTTATLSFDGHTSGWMAGLASGLMRNQAAKDMKKDLASLKSLLESG
jgi:carbon monoxide dehydrogenase subunit G